MDWYLIRYFLAVAEIGNFSRAAAQVNVTQPTLSVGIAKLEALLGHKLFERDKRHVSLTAAGSRFLLRARRIAHEYEIALREAAQSTPPGRWRIGILSTIPTAMIETAVAQHKRQFGAGELELVDGSERDLRNRLEDDRIDLALTILRPGLERFEQESLGWEDYVLVTSSFHRFSHAPILKGEELAEDAMIIRRHCEVLAETSRYFTERGVRPRFGLKTTNDDRAIALVRAGLGVTVMPDSFSDPGTRQIKLADFDLRRHIGLVYSARGHSSRRNEAGFLDAIRNIFRTGSRTYTKSL